MSRGVARLSAVGMAKVDALKVKIYRGRLYIDVPLMSSVLTSILYGCGPAASNDPVTIGGEQSMLESTSREDKVIPIASMSDLPDWMQSALKDPNPEVRLQAVEKWIEQNQSDVGFAMLLINDPDERIRAKAMQVVERTWQTEQRTIQNME
jgi:hypothetical protein